MKLSLWMIANRLEQYDIETSISPTTERTLDGPFPFSTLNSVCIRYESPDVICTSVQGTIIIHGMSKDEGFLLVQSIFSWYEEWLEKVEAALRKKDYRRYVHLCAQAFENPVLFLDANQFLLGMDCRGIEAGSISGWRQISETGQISVPYYIGISNALNDPVRKYSNTVSRFSTRYRPGSGDGTDLEGLHALLRFNTNDFGTITILEKKRPLTLGDVSLLELLADRSAILFAAANCQPTGHGDMQILNELLESRPVPEKRLAFVRSVVVNDSAEDSELYLFLFRYGVEERRAELQSMLQSMIMKRNPNFFIWNYQGDVLVLCNTPDKNELQAQMLSFIDRQGYSDNLRGSVSLPFDEIRDLLFYYEQAVFAVNRLNGPGFFDFYSCGGDYLLETTDRERRIRACEPYCRKVWNKLPEEKKNLETLAMYLKHERAAGSAAAELFIHKNTLNYRVRNLREMNSWDFDDPAVRDYLRLSVYYLSHQQT